MATRHRFHPFLLALLITILAGSVSAQVTGLRTIGGDSPDYTSISAALDDLNLHGVGEGGVTFLIRDGVYDEPHNLIIRDLNSSAENPVVFRPDAGADVVINQTISEDFSWGFRVHNSDHVTFSGIPYGETEGIHLTVNGYRNADDDVFVFWISNGADHVTLANLHIESISDPIHDTGWSTPVYLSTYQVPSPEVGMDGFTVRGCEIVGGSTFGMYLDSEATPNHDINIVNNKIWDWQKYGINLNDQGRYANIEGNEIWQTFDRAAVRTTRSTTTPWS
ncbi:hypothetical protein CSA17_01810 [bacterium DOLJORAL78_65_58]|nr:MAG: hypothetical protein CSA17_01810 [bacterium DOLJORAL78_65_58]